MNEPILDQPDPTIDAALARIPSGLYVFTSVHDGRRSGVIVRWAQPCSRLPPMIMLSVQKGHHVAPLVTESRVFALSQLARDDNATVRRFQLLADEEDGTLLEVGTRPAPSGAPIIERATAWFDCQLVRHLDIESDYEIFVGLVIAADVCEHAGDPFISFDDTWDPPK